MGELMVDQLRAMAANYPDEIGYRDLTAGDQITFAQWEARSNQLARALVSAGVAKGDRVSIYITMDHPLEWVISYSAIHKAGAVAVPTNTRLSVREVIQILSHAEVSAMLTDESLLAGALEIRSHIPNLHTIVTTSGAHGVGVVNWDDFLDADTSEFQVPTELDDLADVMYTSGTTGLPKGVGVRHKNVATLGNQTPSWNNSAWLHSSPLFTFAGIAFVYNPMKLGLVGLYLPKFNADVWLDTVEKERPMFTFLVPAMAQLLIAHPRFGEVDLSSIMLCTIGSAPLAPDTLEKFQERMPDASVMNSYGMTEAGAAFCILPKEEIGRRRGSVGKPSPPTEFQIFDESDNEVPVGEVGEVVIRLADSQREYYKNPEATAETWAGGWLHSGDLGYFDEDGFLYLVGRKKDMIIRGGNNVYPSDIEAVIIEHPAVLDAAVVGIPHVILGEDVGAFVVLREGQDLSADELKAFCAERLADYKVPREVTFTDDLPRNATGKVLKHHLVRPAGDID